MKVQFSEGSVRIRVSRAEFDALCAGATLALDLPVMPPPCAITVRRADAFSAASGAEGLAIVLPAGALGELAARLPSREGLAWSASLEGREVTVELEVDVRSRSAAPTVR